MSPWPKQFCTQGASQSEAPGEGSVGKVVQSQRLQFRSLEVFVLLNRERRRDFFNPSPWRSLSFSLPWVCPMKWGMDRKAGSVNTQVLGSHVVCTWISQLLREQVQSSVFAHPSGGKLGICTPIRWCVCSQAQLSLGALLAHLRTLKHCLPLEPSEYLPVWAALLSRILSKRRWNFWGED